MKNKIIILMIVLFTFTNCSVSKDQQGHETTYSIESFMVDTGGIKLINKKDNFIIYTPNDGYRSTHFWSENSIGQKNPKIKRNEHNYFTAYLDRGEIDFYVNKEYVGSNTITRDQIDKIVVRPVSGPTIEVKGSEIKEILGAAHVEGIVIDTMFGSFIAYKTSEDKNTRTVNWNIEVMEEAMECVKTEKISSLDDIYTLSEQKRIYKDNETRYRILVVGNFQAKVQTNILNIIKVSSGPLYDINNKFLKAMTFSTDGSDDPINIENFYRSPPGEYAPVYKHRINGSVKKRGKILEISREGVDQIMNNNNKIHYRFIRAYSHNRALYQDTNSKNFIAVDIGYDRPANDALMMTGGVWLAPSGYYKNIYMLHIAPVYGWYETASPQNQPQAINNIINLAVLGMGHWIGGNWIVALGHYASILITGATSEASARLNSIELTKNYVSTVGFTEDAFDWEWQTMITWGRMLPKYGCSECNYKHFHEHS